MRTRRTSIYFKNSEFNLSSNFGKKTISLTDPTNYKEFTQEDPPYKRDTFGAAGYGSALLGSYGRSDTDHTFITGYYNREFFGEDEQPLRVIENNRRGCNSLFGSNNVIYNSTNVLMSGYNGKVNSSQTALIYSYEGLTNRVKDFSVNLGRMNKLGVDGSGRELETDISRVVSIGNGNRSSHSDTYLLGENLRTTSERQMLLGFGSKPIVINDVGGLDAGSITVSTDRISSLRYLESEYLTVTKNLILSKMDLKTRSIIIDRSDESSGVYNQDIKVQPNSSKSAYLNFKNLGSSSDPLSVKIFGGLGVRDGLYISSSWPGSNDSTNIYLPDQASSEGYVKSKMRFDNKVTIAHSLNIKAVGDTSGCDISRQGDVNHFGGTPFLNFSDGLTIGPNKSTTITSNGLISTVEALVDRLKAKSYVQIGGNFWNYLGFEKTTGEKRAAIRVQGNNDQTFGKFTFDQYVYTNSDTPLLMTKVDGTLVGCQERFQLPTPTSEGFSSAIDDAEGVYQKWYSILTTKHPVTVAQGGTGANTAEEALTNLGVVDEIKKIIQGVFEYNGDTGELTINPYYSD